MDRTAGHIAALYDPSMGEMFCPVAGTIVTLMREISQLAVADDGIVFPPASFAGEAIKEDADYAGVHTVFIVRVDSARVTCRIDIGFGPGDADLSDNPRLSRAEALRLQPRDGSHRETAGTRPAPHVEHTHEGRTKDYFNLWLLTRQPELNKEVLSTAIKRTFANRGLEIDAAPIGLSSAFGDDPPSFSKTGEAHASATQPLCGGRRIALVFRDDSFSVLSRSVPNDSKKSDEVREKSEAKYYFLMWGILWGSSSKYRHISLILQN